MSAHVRYWPPFSQSTLPLGQHTTQPSSQVQHRGIQMRTHQLLPNRMATTPVYPTHQSHNYSNGQLEKSDAPPLRSQDVLLSNIRLYSGTSGEYPGRIEQQNIQL